MKRKKGWFLYQFPGSEYYAGSAPTKKEYFYHGDGSYRPTPAQMKELFEKHEDSYIEDLSGLVYSYDVADTTKKPITLPSGCYTHHPASPGGDAPERLVKSELRTDAYIKMESIYNPLVDDVKSFLANESVYRKIGSIYKRGLLLYGPPGEGKTSMIRSVVKNELPSDAVVIFFESMPSSDFIRILKETLGARMKVFVFEELANLLEHARIERVLDFLDGEKSIDKTLIIATTNYPERLPGNIVERPSRFDKLYKMGHPNKIERVALLKHYLTREATQDEVTVTEGLSTAAIKEACFLIHLRGLTLPESVKLMKKHAELVKKDFSESRPLGLSASRYDHDE